MTECNGLQMSDHAILEGWFWTPLSAVGGPRQLANLRAQLTYTPKFDDGEKGPVLLYDEVSKPGYIGVPRAFGHHWFGHLPLVDAPRSRANVRAAPP